MSTQRSTSGMTAPSADDETLCNVFAILHWLSQPGQGDPRGSPWRVVPRGSELQRALDEGAVPFGLAERRRDGRQYRLTALGRQRHDEIWRECLRQGADWLLRELEEDETT